MSVFIPIPKKDNAKKSSNYCTIALISHASKVLLRILQARLQQYMNCELPDVQAGFRKGRGTRDQVADICWIIEKAREFQRSIYFCFIGYAKAFDCVNHNKLWKILQEMRISDHLTCLLRNLYGDKEATVRTRQTWNNGLFPNWKRSTSRLHVVIHIIYAYLISMQNTSCEMPGWMKHKVESRLLGEISITSDMQMIPPLWQKMRRN